MPTFRTADLIIKKRDGGELDDDEIDWFVKGVVGKRVQESQIGAMLMAICLKGMIERETISLTKSMMKSGDVLKWPDEWKGLIVDKHSTGGVGDKVSLPLAPALAACGMKVPMISGRGLGFSGGTLDKLESIPGFQVSLSPEKMTDILDKVGCCIVGQSKNLVPADKILYSIRDVTGTVPSTPLITSSIISKKAAESPFALVLDVKCGKAAFMTTQEKAEELARSMVTASNGLGIKTIALLTKMDNPIGLHVGNALEVAESIHCLQGNGPDDLMELVCKLGGHLLFTAGRVNSFEEGNTKLQEVIDNGAALKKFKDMITSQGVKEDVANKLCADDPWCVLRKSKYVTDIKSSKTGFVSSIDAMVLAKVCLDLGAGRAKSGDDVNHSVGCQLIVGIGNAIEQGKPWMKVHHDDDPLSPSIISQLESAVIIDDQAPTNLTRIIDVIT